MLSEKNQLIEDINIEAYKSLSAPKHLKKELNSKFDKFIIKSREAIQEVLNGNDNRLIVIAGPCSIHNIDDAETYAVKLKELSIRFSDKMLIVMRTYFEKPRSTVGWKGFIHDPDLDETDDIEKGIKESRKLLLKVAEMKLPTATEFLNPVTPQYISDLISWAAIGARTTESQTHREVASGLSMPVGFKNDTKGDSLAAVNAINSAMRPHSFLGIDKDGKSSIISTKGNQYSHLILRGGDDNGTFVPNYKDYKLVAELMRKNNVPINIMIDCSHGNSSKDYKNQPGVAREVVDLILQERANLKDDSQEDIPIKGIMLESNLFEDSQKLDKNNLSSLKKGVSITDSCISIETTEKLLTEIYEKL